MIYEYHILNKSYLFRWSISSWYNSIDSDISYPVVVFHPLRDLTSSVDHIRCLIGSINESCRIYDINIENDENIFRNITELSIDFHNRVEWEALPTVVDPVLYYITHNHFVNSIHSVSVFILFLLKSPTPVYQINAGFFNEFYYS